MRLAKAWIVASKDFKTFTKRKSILFSIIGFQIVVSVGLPFMIRYVAEKPNGALVVPTLIDSFSFWFVIAATVIPVSIASYSIVGEKVQKSLEPLLATPTTDEEILAGKALAALLPSIITTYLGAVVFVFLIDVFTSGVFTYLYLPNWNLGVILLLLVPLACLLSVGGNVLISSRATDVRTAQQLGALIILPLAAVYVLSEINVLPLTTTNLLIMAGVLFVLDILMFYMASATFQREEILTKWR